MAIPFLAHHHDPSSEQRQQQDAAALLPFDPNPHSANEQQRHHRHFHHHHQQQQLRDQVLDGAMEMEDVEGAGGEAPAGSLCEGASGTAAAPAAAPASAAAANCGTSAAPPWLGSFLAAPYFVPCSLHAALHKSERNFFCIDCYTSATHGIDSSISSSFHGSHGGSGGSSSPLSSLCSVCVARAHHGHAVLQVRKSSYHDAVRVADIGRLIDVTAIQVYVINGAKIVFLNPRPQARPLKGAPYHCARCQRNLLDAGGHFCSVACKLEVVRLCSRTSNGGSGSDSSSSGSRTGIGDDTKTPRQLLQLKARLLPPQMPLLPGLQQQASKLGAAAEPSSPKKIVIKKLKAPPPAAGGGAAAAAFSAPPGAAAGAAEKGKEVHFHGLDLASPTRLHSNGRCEVEEEEEDDLETVWLKQEAAEALAKKILPPQPPLHPKLLLKRKFQQQMQQQKHQQMQQGDDVTRRQHEVEQQQQQHEKQMKTLKKLQLPPLLIEDKDESSSDYSGVVEGDRCGDREESGEEEEITQAKKRVRRMKEVYLHNSEREGGQTDSFPSLLSHAENGPAQASNMPAQKLSIDTGQHLFNSPRSPHVGTTEGGFTLGPPSPTLSSTSSPWSWRSPRHRRKGMPLRAHLV